MLFGAPAGDVLAAMDEAGDDVPEMTPALAIEIDGVGLERRHVPVTIEDPFGSGDTVTASCDVRVSAGVPASRRGVHVSRIGQTIAEGVIDVYPDLSTYAETLAGTIAAREYGRARVRVHARIPFVEDVQADASSRRKLSLEHLHVIAGHAIEANGRARRDLGLRVTHLLACPCVQQTHRHARRLGGTAPALPLPHQDGVSTTPGFTHSQRCLTRVIVRDLLRPVPIVRMLAALDTVLVRVCNTLPRDAELACVHRAHAAPQFIEDAVRAAVDAVAALWPRSGAFRCIMARARSLESIHEYDLTAAITLRAPVQTLEG